LVAPCVDDNLLSLAICKPMIRSTAKCGDLIFGFAAKSLHPDNRLIYIARVTEKVEGGLYYMRRQFAGRPDRIYRRDRDRFEWRPRARHHGPDDLVHDLGHYPRNKRANVPFSTDFRYFGGHGSNDYKKRLPRIARAVEALTQGARVHHGELLRADLCGLKKQVWADTPLRVAGNPMSAPSRDVCHRGRDHCVL
jgi:hypothetical protein